MTTKSIAAQHGLPLEFVEEQFQEACAAGLLPQRAVEVAALVAQGVVDERKRLQRR